MLNLFLEEGAWFRAKRFGYGAGLPFKWQGWVTLVSYVLVMMGLGLLSDRSGTVPTAVTVTLMLIITALFVAIVRKRTEGGWKWRS